MHIIQKKKQKKNRLYILKKNRKIIDGASLLAKKHEIANKPILEKVINNPRHLDDRVNIYTHRTNSFHTVWVSTDNLLFKCIKTWHQWNASAWIGKKKENNSCSLPTDDGALSSERCRLYWNFTASEERILIKFLQLVYIRSLRVFNLFWPNFRKTAAGKIELQLSNLYTVGFHLQGIRLWADTKSET